MGGAARTTARRDARPRPRAPDRTASAPEFVAWPEEHAGAIHAGAERRLEGQAESVRERGVAVDCELPSGPAAAAVEAAAERHGADPVVAATRGRTAWTRLLIGSTATRLLRTARVRPTDAGSPRPIRAVLVATDFSADCELAAEAARRVLGPFGADRRIIVVHAYRIPDEATYLPAVLMDAISVADANGKRMIEACAAKLRHAGIRVDTAACEGDPTTTILDHARATGADLVAMGAHGRPGMDRLFLGSTAERVVASSPCPVLTVRSDAP